MPSRFGLRVLICPELILVIAASTASTVIPAASSPPNSRGDGQTVEKKAKPVKYRPLRGSAMLNAGPATDLHDEGPPIVPIAVPWMPGPERYIGKVLPKQMGGEPYAPLSQPNAPPIGGSFSGITDTGFFPPDPILAAGPNVLIPVVNGGIALFTKAGVNTLQRSLSGFYNGSLSGGFTFDPRIIYDRHSQRFFAVAVDGNSSPNSWLRIAVSKTSNPGNLNVGTAAGNDWWGFNIDADLDGGSQANANWADFPGLGADQFNLYITANMFSNGRVFQYVKVWVLPKTDLLAGTPPTVFEFGAPPGVLVNPSTNLAEFTVQPALNFDLSNEHMLSTHALGGANGSMTFWTVNNPAGTPTLSAANLLVAGWNSFTVPDCPQSGGGSPLDTGDTRLLNVVERDGRIWATHTQPSADGMRTEARWYQINPTVPAVLQFGQVADPTRCYFYPAIHPDGAGGALMVFSGVDSTIFGSSFFTGRTAGDPDGTMQAVSLLQAGLSHYVRLDMGGRNRWGDYGGISEDPDTGETWMFHEHASATANQWSTAVARTTFGPAVKLMVTSSALSLNAEAHTVCDGVCDMNPSCDASGPVTGFLPGFLNHSLGNWTNAGCGHLITSCPLRATGEARTLVDGVGTGALKIRWDAIAQAYHLCGPRPIWRGNGIGQVLNATLGITPIGLPDGTPVTVDFRWWQGTANNARPELLGPPRDDISDAVAGSLTIAGTTVFNGEFDVLGARNFLFSENNAGSFQATAGTEFQIIKSSPALPLHQVDMNEPGEEPTFKHDHELVAHAGELRLSANGPPLPLGEACAALQRLDFSVDMGSDASLSDVAPFEGNERFDPGDMYLYQGAALPAGGADGLRDDGSVFGFDPPPAAPGPPVPDACSGTSAASIMLDVDGSDSLDAALAGTIGLGGPFPIQMAPSNCVHRAEFLLISLEDDGPVDVYSNSPCNAPSSAVSDVLGTTYGSVAFEDEIVGLNLVSLNQPLPIPPFDSVTYPFASEPAVHPSLSPAPPGTSNPAMQSNDDDIDALDETTVECSVWLFSVDHEANAGLDPGVIYQGSVGAAVPWITPGQLGLFTGVDIRDFEFVVSTNPATGFDTLTLLFTVAPDDFSTGPNDSGGLNPRMIYGSYLTGDHFEFLTTPPSFPVSGSFIVGADSIDGLAAMCLPEILSGSDSDGDGVPDSSDCAPLDPTASAAPGEVAGLTVSNSGVLGWNSTGSGSGTVYDVLRGSISALPVGPGGGDEVCIANDLAATSTTSAAFPGIGGGFWYLVSAFNSCGTGTYGSTSGGAPRTSATCP